MRENKVLSWFDIMLGIGSILVEQEAVILSFTSKFFVNVKFYGA